MGGDLTEIRRLYVQDGKIIKNSGSPALGENFDSISESYCNAQKKAYFNPESPAPNDFVRKGGLKSMGKALDRGVVLVLSLWDDKLTNMNWLDSKTGTNKGGDRGPCSPTSGAPDNVRAKYPNAFATYTNIMYGEIGSTYTAAAMRSKPENAATGNTAYANALKAYSGPPPSMQPQQPQQPQPQPQQPQQPLQQPQQQSQPVSSSGCATAWGQCGGQGWAEMLRTGLHLYGKWRLLQSVHASARSK